MDGRTVTGRAVTGRQRRGRRLGERRKGGTQHGAGICLSGDQISLLVSHPWKSVLAAFSSLLIVFRNYELQMEKNEFEGVGTVVDPIQSNPSFFTTLLYIQPLFHSVFFSLWIVRDQAGLLYSVLCRCGL